MNEKFCGGCKRMLPMEQFSFNRSARDGHATQCKECIRAYHRNRRAIARVQERAYWKANPERKRAKRKRDYARNREQYRARARNWYRQNKERARATSKAYRQNHKDLYRRLVSARRRGLGSLDKSSHAFIEILKRDPCSYCGAPCQEIDHIQPVAENGVNHWQNLTASCLSCNRRKNKKSLLSALLWLGETNA